jgi:hypothetical protein
MLADQRRRVRFEPSLYLSYCYDWHENDPDGPSPLDPWNASLVIRRPYQFRLPGSDQAFKVFLCNQSRFGFRSRGPWPKPGSTRPSAEGANNPLLVRGHVEGGRVGSVRTSEKVRTGPALMVTIRSFWRMLHTSRGPV